MSPLTLLLLLFTFTYASVEGRNTRNLQGFYYSDNPTIAPTQNPTEFPTSDNFNYEFYYSDNPTIAPTQNPTEFPTSDNFNYEFYYSDNPTFTPTQNPVEDGFFYEDSPTQTPTEFPTAFPTANPIPEEFNYFGDYYFNYENDQAFCNIQERRTLGGATAFSRNIVDFLRDIESECGTNAECIPDFLTNNFNISFSCGSCFIDFISDVAFDCSFVCFGEDQYADFECIDCIESFSSFAEIEFENCIGADFVPDEEFNTCSEQLEAEEIIDLPQTLQDLFEGNCKNGGFSTLSGSKCMTSEAFFNFQVEENCADCIGSHAICVNEFCRDQCLFGDLSDCIRCVENSRCAFDFDFCSGLNLYFRGNGYNNYNTGDFYNTGNYYNTGDFYNTGNYYNTGDFYNTGNYYGFYNTGNYYGGNVVFDTIIAIFNDFFVNFIGEFINNFSILLFGE